MSKLVHGNGSDILNPDAVLEIYVIGLKGGTLGLFAPTDLLQFFEEQSDDRVRRAIAWLCGNRFRVVSWLGRVFNTAHGYYTRLETRLDPTERILKAMGSSKRHVIFFSPAREKRAIEKYIGARLRRESVKHLVWLVVDLILSAASLTIAWLPGPNLVGWYPFLRSLSHYGAFAGVRQAKRAGVVEFTSLPALRTLEENLHAPNFDRTKIHEMVRDLNISGLEQYLERMF